MGGVEAGHTPRCGPAEVSRCGSQPLSTSATAFGQPRSLNGQQGTNAKNLHLNCCLPVYSTVVLLLTARQPSSACMQQSQPGTQHLGALDVGEGDRVRDPLPGLTLEEGLRTMTAPSSESAPELAARQPAAERITVALISKAAEDLKILQVRTRLSKTDVVNRAITLYEFIDAQLRAGQDLLIRDRRSGEILTVRILLRPGLASCLSGLYRPTPDRVSRVQRHDHGKAVRRLLITCTTDATLKSYRDKIRSHRLQHPFVTRRPACRRWVQQARDRGVDDTDQAEHRIVRNQGQSPQARAKPSALPARGQRRRLCPKRRSGPQGASSSVSRATG